MTALDWMVGGACSRPEVTGLPWTADDTTARDRARMARVCAACPMLPACRLFVATNVVTAGFWAGHDRNEADLPDTRPAATPSPSSARSAAAGGGVPVQEMLPGLAQLLAVA